MFHVRRVRVVRLLSAETDPEEVVRLFTLVQDLDRESLRIVGGSDDVFRDLDLVRIGLGPDPDVNDSGFVLRIEGYFEDVDEAGVERAGVRLYLNAATAQRGAVRPFKIQRNQ